MFKKLIAGAGTRKSRLHDETGNRISTANLLVHGPMAFASGLLRLTLGYRRVKPWISYDAQQVLSDLLTPQSDVLEFGSGMSTVWYAERSRSVTSVDDFKPWHDKVTKIIASRKIKNVDYRLITEPEEYGRAGLTTLEPSFDFIMIDGSFRDKCTASALKLIRPGGFIYLDNCDKGLDAKTGDIPGARQWLVEFARERKGEVTYFTDFAPTQLFVQQGMLVKLPA